MNKGFTIVELLSVILILALLIVIIMPTYNSVNENIRKKNYDSRKNEIKTQTLSFVEKYAKDIAHDSNGNNNVLCFSPSFLIQNGIITSDSDEQEYIKNDLTMEEYSGINTYIKILYKTTNKEYKLYAITIDEADFNTTTTTCTKTDKNIFK